MTGRLILGALLAIWAPFFAARAQTASILSGEHEDFTRLVIQMQDPGAWALGRTERGYAFAVRSDAQPRYDLSRIWDRIPRSRLQSISVNPDTGALDLSLACDCHIYPFEYGAGNIVLDVKAGPAPAGSAFEKEFLWPSGPLAAIDSGRETDLPESSAARDGAGYDWLARASSGTGTRSTFPLPLATGAVSLDPLRDELLQQLARGAAEGIVDMELPGRTEAEDDAEGSDLPWSNIRIGEQPGIVVTDPNSSDAGARPVADCAAPDLLDIASWGDGHLPQDLIARARDGLFGEFDRPDEEVILSSMQTLLYLGFGAEARQHADLLGKASAGEASLYRAMGLLIDGQSDPESPFADMLDCDGPAALWAALARNPLPPGPGIKRDAILRAFQALPSHLRQHLGPGLAEKFLARDDPEAARLIRDAINRAPEVDDGVVALLDAKAELHKGDADAAQGHAETAVSLDGNGAENLIALVEAHFRQLEPIRPDVAEALLATDGESSGTELAAAVDRAIVLALALSGQTDAAFSHDAGSAQFAADLWHVVQARAENDDFLRQAVLPTGSPRPDVLPEDALLVAERLLALGFPDAARLWIGDVGASDAHGLRLAAANAEIARGDARGALALLSASEDAAAEALRAKALVQLGDLAEAASALSASGDPEAAARLSLWRGDWQAMDDAVPDHWKTAAGQAQPASSDAALGLLGRGEQTIEASLASRTAIEALLTSVPSPAGAGQQ